MKRNLDSQTAKAAVAPAPKVQTARVQVKQTDVPTRSLGRTLAIAQALWDYYGGKAAAPLRLAATMNLSPQSSNWRLLTGAAVAYGLTEGAYNANEIKLTDLGKRSIAPVEDGEDLLAMREAVLRPTVVGGFLRRLDQRRLPADNISLNILHELGVPVEKRPATLELIKENAQLVGFLLETKGALYIDLQGGGRVSPPKTEMEPDSAPVTVNGEGAEVAEATDPAGEEVAREEQRPERPDFQKVQRNARVFISHGANKKIVAQLEQILRYGKYDPIVAAENETTAKPLSEKVFDAMRGCFAGIINVHPEGEWQDSDGALKPRLNENVLIEIGAAMALYPGRFILLVQEGVKLPTNISGLYQCRYAGDDLGFDAAMKVLKAFNEFEQQ